MPQIYVDKQRIEAKPGKTIIEACYENGIEVPHFCWHPDLSVSGNCRMCLVEVGMPKKNPDGSDVLDSSGQPEISFFPKLQIACATQIADGMVVKMKDKKAVAAQEAVMEFLLINHPLDCPICDESGECKLQEYTFRHSTAESRLIDEKNHKRKRVKWGPHVMFDAERCISCSRCIRYAKEVAKQDILSFVKRGDHVTIEVADGKEFDNPYSMNVIEICPVGALTSRDFRFKSRVWEMSFNPSISFADSTGSNNFIGVRNNEILRIEPRANLYVNRFWLSDDARLNYIDMVNKNRLIEPQIRIDSLLKNVDWEEAIDHTVKELKKYKHNEVMFVSSARATTEDNYAFQKFAKSVFNTHNIDYLEHIDESKVDDFLGVADRTPNANGLKEVAANYNGKGLKAIDLADNIKTGKIKALVVMEENFDGYENIVSHLDKLSLLVYLGYNKDKVSELADIILPATTYAESEGTYVNKDKRVQYFAPALATKDNLRFMGLKMSRWDKFGASNDSWSQHEIRNCKQSWKIISKIAKGFGVNFQYTTSEDVFDEITRNVSSFKDMNYERLEEYRGIKLNMGSNPDPKILHYISHTLKPHY